MNFTLCLCLSPSLYTDTQSCVIDLPVQLNSLRVRIYLSDLFPLSVLLELAFQVLDEHLPSTKGWLSIDQAPIFTPDYYFIKMPVADGSNGYFDHVVMVYLSGAKKHFLTHGSIVVTKLIAYRPDIHTL